MYYEISISPAHGGFGEFQANPSEGTGWFSSEELLAEIANQIDVELFELPLAVLPEGLEDITGRIQNEPSRVFGFIGANGPTYFGITKK